MTVYAGEVADPGAYNRDTRKMVARARRETNSTATTTEIAVLRIDGLALKSGRHYRISTSPLHLASTVNADAITARLRYTTDGSTATTSSTQLGQLTTSRDVAASESAPMVEELNPSSDQTVSIVLTVGRTIGTGNVSIEGNAIYPICVWVDDMGVDTGNVGISL